MAELQKQIAPMELQRGPPEEGNLRKRKEKSSPIEM
jgi:hypothetical protein